MNYKVIDADNKAGYPPANIFKGNQRCTLRFNCHTIPLNYSVKLNEWSQACLNVFDKQSQSQNLFCSVERRTIPLRGNRVNLFTLLNAASTIEEQATQL